MSAKTAGFVTCVIVAVLCAARGAASAAAFTISGSVISGPPGNSMPVADSTVTLYQAGVSSFGVTPVLQVTTKKTGKNRGKFTMQFRNKPAPGAVLYLVATGGNVGGVTNSAIKLVAMLGEAGPSPKEPFPHNLIQATVNELTTVAAAYVLSNYIDPPVPLYPNNCDHEYSICDISPAFLTSAIVSIPNLVDVNTGALGSVIDNGNNDPRRLDTLANALANCVRGNAGACTSLFDAANLPTASTDTFGAIVNINKSPANHVNSIFALGSTGPYLPILTAAPSDWTLALNFAGGGLNDPYGIAIDADGDVWVANFGGNSVTELNSAGVPSTSSPFTGLNSPFGIVVDSASNVWVTNNAGNSVSEITPAGVLVPPFSGGGLNAPKSFAVDEKGNFWIPNGDQIVPDESPAQREAPPLYGITELSASGNPVPQSPFTGGGLNSPSATAVDGFGNIWAANCGSLCSGTVPANGVALFDPNGVPVSPVTGFTVGGLQGSGAKQGIAADNSCHIWITNFAGSVSELTSVGVAVGLSPFTGGGINEPFGIAVDGSGSVWVANEGNNSISELNSSGTPLSPATGFIGVGVGLEKPQGIAISRSGDVWVTNSGGAVVTDFIGAATAVSTPLMPPKSKCVTPEALTTTSLASSANPSVFGQSVTFTASVTVSGTGSGTPTGNVTFFDDTTEIGSGTLNATGQATLIDTTLAVGTHSITATYGGDTNFIGSTSTALAQQVNAANTTTSLASSLPSSLFGQPVTFTATVIASAPGAGTPTGNVNFFDGATQIGTGNLNAGQATLIDTTLAVGTHSITATYGGDSNFNGSTSSALTQKVTDTTTTSLASSLNPSVFGQPVTFTATVTATGAGAGTPTGNVNFFDGATQIGTGTLNAAGKAALIDTTLTVGTHSITAVYAGDGNYTGSTSSALTQKVTDTTTTSLVSSLNPSLLGQLVTFTATVTASGAGAGTPTGNVTFFDGATQIGTGTLNAAGNATLNDSTLAFGTHSITAVYAGDGNYTGSTSSAVSQAVNLKSNLTIYMPVLEGPPPPD
jgi:streptogramin lyase